MLINKQPRLHAEIMAVPLEENASERCTFVDTPSGRKLAYEQLQGSSPGLVYVHGLCSTMNGVKATALKRYCSDKEISYLRFDLSGHGGSSCPFKDCTISQWLEDIEAILELLTSGPQVLIGSSIGAWLVFLYTMRNPDRVYGIVGIATAADFTHRLWQGLDKEERGRVKQTGVYHLPSPYMEKDNIIEITLDLIVDGDKHSILDMPGLQLIKAPTWLLHGDTDTVVPPSISLQLMQHLQCSVELKIIEGGDHRLCRPEDIELLFEAINSLLHLSASTDLTSSGEFEDEEDGGGATAN